jgi:hypothetical protein
LLQSSLGSGFGGNREPFASRSTDCFKDLLAQSFDHQHPLVVATGSRHYHLYRGLLVADNSDHLALTVTSASFILALNSLPHPPNTVSHHGQKASTYAGGGPYSAREW